MHGQKGLPLEAIPELQQQHCSRLQQEECRVFRRHASVCDSFGALRNVHVRERKYDGESSRGVLRCPCGIHIVGGLLVCHPGKQSLQVVVPRLCMMFVNG